MPSPATRPISADILAAHPATAPALLQTFHDLAHAARWTRLEPVPLTPPPTHAADDHTHARGRRTLPGLVGWKKDEKQASLVVPLRTTDQITPLLLADIFASLHALPNPFPFHSRPHGPTLLTPNTPPPTPPPPPHHPHASVPLRTDAVTIAVLGPDGTVVYYHLAQGIRKPIN